MRKRETINPVFKDFRVISPQSVELAIYIRSYRRMHEISQMEMAKICTIRGRRNNVSFTQNDIDRYEKYKNVPTPPKFQILMETMNITPSDLQ